MRRLHRRDVLVLARPPERRRTWSLIGVAPHHELARCIAALFASAHPGREVRFLEPLSLARELGEDEREAVLDQLHNPTLGEKRQWEELRREAQSLLASSERSASVGLGALE